MGGLIGVQTICLLGCLAMKSHLQFLSTPFPQALSSKAVLVGLATDALTNHKRGASSIQPFEVRRDAVLRFMEMVKPDLHGKIDAFNLPFH